MGNIGLTISISAVVGLLISGCVSGVRPELSAVVPPPDVALSDARSAPDRPSRGPGGFYRGRLIDIHAHLLGQGGDSNGDYVLTAMAEAGVDVLVLTPTPNDGTLSIAREIAAGRVALAKRAAGHIFRGCGSEYLTVWMNDVARSGYRADELDERLNRLKGELSSGTCLTIGEIGPFHFEKSPGQSVLDFPITFAPMMQVAQIAAQSGVPLDLHAEPITPLGVSRHHDVFGGIAALFANYPQLKLILAHNAMTSAANARALLVRYPNLMMHFKLVKSGHSDSWDNLEPVVNGRHELYQDWAELMEAMPDRFMVGSDMRFGDRDKKLPPYTNQIRLMRRLLGSLTPAAAESIAHRNAERLWPVLLRDSRPLQGMPEFRDGKSKNAGGASDQSSAGAKQSPPVTGTGEMIGPIGLTARQVIAKSDANHDGKLARNEFHGPPQGFQVLDADGDGFVTSGEFEAFWIRRAANAPLGGVGSRLPAPDALPPSPGVRNGEMVGPRGMTARQIITNNDNNGDGKLAPDEFHGPPKTFHNLDANGDGFITQEEFEATWRVQMAR